ncbi:MAG: peptidase M50, partial [Planctomycetota bacterium]
MSTAIRSLTSLPLPVRCRADLVVQAVRHRNEASFVVKDPVALKYHRLRGDEWAILRRLDGTASLDSLCEFYNDAFRPQTVRSSDINALLLRFHSLSLTVSDAPGQAESMLSRRSRQTRQEWMGRISSLLFIRFPGVDPEPLLRRLYPLVRPFLGRSGAIAYAMLLTSAMVVFLAAASQFWSEVPAIDQWLQFNNLFLLAAVIGGTKILHEFGHAVMCKHFGGECHQIGPMLLVFTPALYCDTSDSWMLPSGVQRAMVGVAGIAVEVGLAAVATWLGSAPMVPARLVIASP